MASKFNNLRFILLDSIQTLIPNNNNIDINIDLLLHGNRSFSYDLNTEIFRMESNKISKKCCYLLMNHYSLDS
jgi:hypothetical protein